MFEPMERLALRMLFHQEQFLEQFSETWLKVFTISLHGPSLARRWPGWCQARQKQKEGRILANLCWWGVRVVFLAVEQCPFCAKESALSESTRVCWKFEEAEIEVCDATDYKRARLAAGIVGKARQDPRFQGNRASASRRAEEGPRNEEGNQMAAGRDALEMCSQEVQPRFDSLSYFPSMFFR